MPRILKLMEIHRRTGISMAHVSKIYSGTRRPSVDAAQKMAAAQGLTVDAFLKQLAAEVKKKKKGRAA